MKLINSLFSAFLMYSRIPVPNVEWKEENRQWALCFFPLVGAVIGGVLLLWLRLGSALGVNGLLLGAVAAAVPVLITGGIHFDGYCDVCDALACWGTREKMLEVMDDPHIGSFAAVRLGLYLLIQAGLFSQLKNQRMITVCSLIFIQSRALSGLGAVTLRCAKKDGALQSFRRPAHKRAVVISVLAILSLTLVLSLLADPLPGLCAFAAEVLSFAHYRRMSYKKFGGVTGDLAGYFLQTCELAALAASVGADLIRGYVL